MFLLLALIWKNFLDSPLICVSVKTDGIRTVSKTNDPGVKMMRELHLGSEYSYAEKAGTVLA